MRVGHCQALNKKALILFGSGLFYLRSENILLARTCNRCAASPMWSRALAGKSKPEGFDPLKRRLRFRAIVRPELNEAADLFTTEFTNLIIKNPGKPENR